MGRCWPGMLVWALDGGAMDEEQGLLSAGARLSSCCWRAPGQRRLCVSCHNKRGRHLPGKVETVFILKGMTGTVDMVPHSVG